MDASKIDIVIPNYNGQGIISRCLSHVRGHDSVVVVDDASMDKSVETVRNEYPDVQIVEREKNGGFSKAVNDGIRIGHREFVLLLNNDVFVDVDALLPLVSHFKSEDVFAVSPKIVLPEKGGIDEGANTLHIHHGMFYAGQFQSESITEMLYTTACAAIYRRSMLEAIGGFDEAYSPFYFEDADLGYRAWKRGWRSLYDPQAKVDHMHSATIAKINRGYTAQIKARNSFFFMWRNLEDEGMLRTHFSWLPLVIAKKFVMGDSAFLSGYLLAAKRKAEAMAARDEDAKMRRLSDREIFSRVGVETG